MKEFSCSVEGYRSTDVDFNFLKRMVGALWEGSSRRVKSKLVKPAGALFVDSNSSPGQILPHMGALADKIKFLCTGFQPLDHENKMELVAKLLAEGYNLYNYLPVHMGILMNSVFPKITDLEMGEVRELLKNPKDDREGQIVV